MRFADTKRTCGIDLNADPIYVPEGYEVIEHIQGGLLNWNYQRPKIELYLTPSQRKGVVQGEKVLEELEEFDGIPVNANALDFFINSLPYKPWIIPEDWKRIELHKTKYILFWGTRYRFEGGICVRTLCWSADARVQEWKAGYCWVDNLLNSQYSAAMIRKSEIKTET
jgi:hypothetical protein